MVLSSSFMNILTCRDSWGSKVQRSGLRFESRRQKAESSGQFFPFCHSPANLTIRREISSKCNLCFDSMRFPLQTPSFYFGAGMTKEGKQKAMDCLQSSLEPLTPLLWDLRFLFWTPSQSPPPRGRRLFTRASQEWLPPLLGED